MVTLAKVAALFVWPTFASAGIFDTNGPRPLAQSEPCEDITSSSPGPCYSNVLWAMQTGFADHSDYYDKFTSLRENSSFADFQYVLHAKTVSRDGRGWHCPRPCSCSAVLCGIPDALVLPAPAVTVAPTPAFDVATSTTWTTTYEAEASLSFWLIYILLVLVLVCLLCCALVAWWLCCSRKKKGTRGLRNVSPDGILDDLATEAFRTQQAPAFMSFGGPVPLQPVTSAFVPQGPGYVLPPDAAMGPPLSAGQPLAAPAPAQSQAPSTRRELEEVGSTLFEVPPRGQHQQNLHLQQEQQDLPPAQQPHQTRQLNYSQVPVSEEVYQDRLRAQQEYEQ
eukprot:CAMPEP_0117570560 /NCGR_PEP_ID=MMETSP0784-20121206/59264_1 /TAXON_ID=39447 /ORGANISM="" /LENGTH=335 /DNA_ID=CAMNT_0005368623 /DNA_START=20 /DNA_END=1024 /DNA_ORIENTATION=+